MSYIPVESYPVLKSKDGYTCSWIVGTGWNWAQTVPVDDIDIGVYIGDGPVSILFNGAIHTTTYSGIKITAATWFTAVDQLHKIFEVLYSYTGNNIVPNTITQNLYALDGVTVLHSIVDTITYQNNIFESVRNRTIT
jgi:hypothetical protein